MSDRNEPDDPASFARDVPLTDVFGSHPKTLLISALLTESSEPVTHFTVNELARITGLEESAVETHVAELASVGIVTETDDLEDANTYVLDEETDAVDAIRRLYDVLFELASERDATD